MTNNLIIVEKNIPNWLSRYDGGWQWIVNMPIKEIPPKAQIVLALEYLTNDPKCDQKQAVLLFEQLSVLPTGANDKRMDSYLITEIVIKDFMDFPVWVGKKAVVNLLHQSRWLPAPVEISDELKAIYRSVSEAISCLENLKKRRNLHDIETVSSNGFKSDIYAKNSLNQTVRLDFKVNQNVFYKVRETNFRRSIIDLDYKKFNIESKEEAEQKAGRPIDPKKNHWPQVDEYLGASEIAQRCKHLGLSNWFESLADYAVWSMLRCEDGYLIADVDKVICMSGFDKLMDVFEVEYGEAT
ncbi:MAG: hypothetical protein HRU29_15560 [Rhizobiales bacterium]|nr:hypothetical protein [Hyphomicrobiales bacterium]NRB15813.1 hypothetical protein [Hyphomicrobiales bacterium]